MFENHLKKDVESLAKKEGFKLKYHGRNLYFLTHSEGLTVTGMTLKECKLYLTQNH